MKALYEVAQEIKADWKSVHPAAKPYLDAMRDIPSNDPNYPYGAEKACDIVAYFLSNAATWKGETARRIKAELRQWLKN